MATGKYNKNRKIKNSVKKMLIIYRYISWFYIIIEIKLIY